MRIVIFLAALLLPFLATAAGPSATITWTPPTQYTSGEAIPSGDLATYTVSWSRTAGGAVVGSKVVTAPASSTVVSGLTCNSFVFVVTVTTSATALYPTATSDPSSPPASYATGVRCAPLPPSGVTAS